MIEYLGNMELLKQPMSAFLAPSKIDPTSVLPTLDWAGEMAQSGRVVVSGFSSRLEQDVWDVLVRGNSPIVSVLVWNKYKLIPDKYKLLLEQGRLLLVFLGLGVRLNRKNAPRRNQYVASLAGEVVFPSITPASSLYQIYNSLIDENKPVTVISNTTNS